MHIECFENRTHIIPAGKRGFVVVDTTQSQRVGTIFLHKNGASKRRVQEVSVMFQEIPGFVEPESHQHSTHALRQAAVVFVVPPPIEIAFKIHLVKRIHDEFEPGSDVVVNRL
jgi:hypothetical protein